MDRLISSLINDTIVNLGKYSGYVSIKHYQNNVSLSINGTYLEPSEFFGLLREYKDANKWLYNEIFEKHVEYLI
jgi:hypothetical protein